MLLSLFFVPTLILLGTRAFSSHQVSSGVIPRGRRRCSLLRSHTYMRVTIRCLLPLGGLFFVAQIVLLASHSIGDRHQQPRQAPVQRSFILGGSAHAAAVVVRPSLGGPQHRPGLRGANAAAAAPGRGVPLPELAALCGAGDAALGNLLALARRALANSSSRSSVPRWLREVVAESEGGSGSDDARSTAASRRGWFSRAKLGVLVAWGPYSVAGWAPHPGDEVCGERLSAADLAAVGLSPSGNDGMYDALESEVHAAENYWRCNPLVEWYGNTMSVRGSPARAFHTEAFGGGSYAALARTFDAHASAWLANGSSSADAWSHAFASAGARYVVVSAKGHDGFALWPTECSGVGGFAGDVAARCSTQRDVVGRAMHAVRERGMRFGVYASTGLDFNFNGVWAPGSFESMLSPPFARPDLAGGDEDDDASEWNTKLAMAAAARRKLGLVGHCDFATRQLRELIDRFAPDVIWNDGGFPRCAGGDSSSEWSAVLTAHRAARPSGVTNDRGPRGGRGDFNSQFTLGQNVKTAALLEQHWRPRGSVQRAWELRVPLQASGSFGLNTRRFAGKYRSTSELIHVLADVVSKNGNVLLGVSPNANGTIPTPQLQRLQRLGNWLGDNGGAIFDTTPVGGNDGEMCCARVVSTKVGGRAVTGEVRFTRGQRGELYAIVLTSTTAKQRSLKVRTLALRPARIDDLDATVHLLPRTPSCEVSWKNRWVDGAWQVNIAIHKSAQCRRTRDAHAFTLEITGGATIGVAATVPPAVAAHEGDDEFAQWETT